MFISQAFDEFLSLTYERIDHKSVKVRLPVQPLFINSVGVVHGGILSALADVAMCNTVQPDENQLQKVVTVDLNVTFLKGAKGDELVADAKVVKKGKKLTHTECSIYDEQGDLVARGKAVLFNS